MTLNSTRKTKWHEIFNLFLWFLRLKFSKTSPLAYENVKTKETLNDSFTTLETYG